MSKYAFFVTMSRGYLFSLNATMNALQKAGTKANFEVVYDNVRPDYREAAERAFDFNVVWTHRNEITCDIPEVELNWFSYKYKRCLDVWNNYDVICIIDGDHFLYNDMTPYFGMCEKENKIVTSHNERYSGHFEQWKLGDPDCVNWEKSFWYWLDTPFFLNTHLPLHRKIMGDWLYYHRKPDLTRFHMVAGNPCGALHRSLCKNLASLKEGEQIVTLDHYIWMADYMISVNATKLEDDKLFYTAGPRAGQQIMGIHNRWWQIGRADCEFRDHRIIAGVFMDNMNLITTLMRRFNDMKLADMVDDHITEEIKTTV